MALTLQPLRDWADVQANFDKLVALLRRLSGVDIGTVTLTWPGAAANSNIAVVTHRLGVTPTQVLATPFLGAGGITQNFTAPLAWTFTSTTFQLQARPIDSSVQPNTATQPYMWVAFA